MRVLIADDSKGAAEMLAEFVRRSGHEVSGVICSGGIDAVDSFERDNPDVVLMDVMMPRLNGVVACRAIKRKNGRARVVLISGRVSSENPFLANCGASALMEKPIHLAQIEQLLESFEKELEDPAHVSQPRNGEGVSRDEVVVDFTGSSDSDPAA